MPLALRHHCGLADRERLTDRFGGRYVLVTGATLFAAGSAAVAKVASLTSDSFTLWLLLGLAAWAWAS